MRYILGSSQCFWKAQAALKRNLLHVNFVSPCVKFSTSALNYANIDIKTPPFPESISEGDIRWLKKVGDHVEIDETVGEIETDKTSIVVSASQAGLIKKFYIDDGSKVKADQPLFVLDTDVKIPSKETDTVTTPGLEVKGSLEYVMAPAFPESISEGDVRWKIKIGDVVRIDDLLGELETDKTSIEIRSSVSGVVAQILIPEGNKVKNGDKLVQIEKKELPVTAPKVVTKPEVVVPKREPVVEVKKLDTVSLPVVLGSERTDTRVKMTRIRQTVAHRLKNAQNTLAMLTTFNETDMSNLMDMRKKHQEEFIKKHGIKLGFMSTFIAAACHALKTVPTVNAYIDGEDIVYHNYTDVSVAVATPKGLVVPVIRDADKLSFADIEKSLILLAEKARNNKLTIEDMEGGNFTITNGGVFGSLLSTPIVNPPQSAILGLHAINERPVAINGNVVIRPMMYIALTYDHRLLDGREAVTFLKEIKECVEDPQRLLLDL